MNRELVKSKITGVYRDWDGIKIKQKRKPNPQTTVVVKPRVILPELTVVYTQLSATHGFPEEYDPEKDIEIMLLEVVVQDGLPLEFFLAKGNKSKRKKTESPNAEDGSEDDDRSAGIEASKRRSITDSEDVPKGGGGGGRGRGRDRGRGGGGRGGRGGRGGTGGGNGVMALEKSPPSPPRRLVIPSILRRVSPHLKHQQGNSSVGNEAAPPGRVRDEMGCVDLTGDSD
jgi:hypothetical protein